MNNYGDTKKLLFKHEVLRARLEIRDFFLKHTVREVYENIGQVLSLVRLQLAMIAGTTDNTSMKVESSGHLVGQSIKELRAMCKSFYPDQDILKHEGFIKGLEDVLNILFDTEVEISVKGDKLGIEPELTLIVFNLVKEILVAIKEAKGYLNQFVICYSESGLTLTIDYEGETFQLQTLIADDKVEKLSFEDRIRLIDSQLSVEQLKIHLHQIKLSIPLKINNNG